MFAHSQVVLSMLGTPDAMHMYRYISMNILLCHNKLKKENEPNSYAPARPHMKITCEHKYTPSWCINSIREYNISWYPWEV